MTVKDKLDLIIKTDPWALPQINPTDEEICKVYEAMFVQTTLSDTTILALLVTP